MSWNYRVMRKRWEINGHVSDTLAIHEAYYKKKGDENPNGWTSDPVYVSCDEEEGVETLRRVLQRMLVALDKPIVEYIED